ncbi:hypothetical protein A1359_16330 [Methylomonas lenta]|uniref:Cytochrome C oxidase subunit I n=1 Tax=Methylomonas lenta TaxID=980561 RepID=A0A177MZ61_9GAMM|nr:hypothetical protein [Methylomonas lenta]OAI10573.1 hypothetical protein A1359_16330 [Methylomonas lenta]
MNKQHKKNRITILVIFAMSIIPFAFAWYLADNPGKVKLGSNNGDLISPPLPTELKDFAGYDAFSAENINQLQGHWVLINVLPEAQCSEACQDGLYKTQQITLMLGKDIARIRRLAVIYNQAEQPLPKQWQEDARLLKVVPSAELKEIIAKTSAKDEPGGLLIMDPLGNLMMKYPTNYDPYKVRNDLSKLLRISQIG